MDDLDMLESELTFRTTGWHRHRNHETGVLAFFPETARDVTAWEARATAQAAESERMEAETRPEPKPLENTLVNRTRRGD